MNHKMPTVLANLFASYFHQDWVDEFSNEDRVLAAMQESEPSAKIAEACREISSILTAEMSEAELKSLLHIELGCYFEPTSKGVTAKEWLTSVGNRLGSTR